MSWMAVAVGASTVISAYGQSQAADAQEEASRAQGAALRASAEARKVAADYQAAQLRVNAGQAQAQGQAASVDEMRRSRLIQSRALALAAASGGGASDPTVIHLISNLALEGELARRTQLYNGDERARSLRNQALATEYEGLTNQYAGINAQNAANASADAISTAGKWQVASTLVSGAASMAGRFSGGSSLNEGSGYMGNPDGSFSTVKIR